MRVKILSATVENFGSVQRADYGLHDLGLVLVEGRNLDDPQTPSNGAGKSTLFPDAPTWALFGTAKDLSSDQVVNDKIGKNCAVTVRTEIPEIGICTIQRFRKVGGKSGLRLWRGRAVQDLAEARDGHEAEVTSLDVSETQRQIEDLLGLDLEVWRSAVYRAQDDEARFAALTDAQQKARLTKVFQLDVIDQWREAATEAQRGLASQLGAVELEIQALGSQDLEAQLIQVLTAEKEYEAQRTQQLAELDQDLATRRQHWQQAQASAQRELQLQETIRQLRASPPLPPQLEPEPPAPALELMPVGPPRPNARSIELVTAPQLPLPVPLPVEPEPEEVRALGHRQQSHSLTASTLQERIRGLEVQAVGLEAEARKLEQLRRGTCRECGSQLTPEHADQEAAARRGRAAEIADEIGGLRNHAAEALGAARACAEEAERQTSAWRARVAQVQAQQGLALQEHQRRQRGAAHAAEVENQRRQREEQHRFATELTAWEADEASRRRAWEADRSRRLQAWQQAAKAVAERNAARVAEAQAGWSQQLQVTQAELTGVAGAGARSTQIEQEGRVLAARRQEVANRVSSLTTRRQDLAARVAQLGPRRAELDAKCEALRRQATIVDFWHTGFGPGGLKSFCLDERVQELTDRTNHWLRVLTGGVYWVRFETQQQTKAKKLVDKFSIRVFRHRRGGGIAEREWSAWSGGQRGRVGIAIDLAMADAVAARAHRAFDLLVMDEVFKGLDAGGRETTMEALLQLRQERGSVVIIDHDAMLRASFEKRIVVELKDEESRIVP